MYRSIFACKNSIFILYFINKIKYKGGTAYVRTQTTVKERDRGKWWMDGDMICPKTIEADNLPQLLELYREAVSDMVSISDNAIKNKNAMYIDLPNGGYKQVGYVITGKTYFEDQEVNYSKEHYIDTWIHIDELRDVDFSECPGNSL